MNVKSHLKHSPKKKTTNTYISCFVSFCFGLFCSFLQFFFVILWTFIFQRYRSFGSSNEVFCVIFAPDIVACVFSLWVLFWSFFSFFQKDDEEWLLVWNVGQTEIIYLISTIFVPCLRPHTPLPEMLCFHPLSSYLIHLHLVASSGTQLILWN